LFHTFFIFAGKPSNLYDTTNPDWAPSLRLDGTEVQKTRTDKKRYDRVKKRTEMKAVHEMAHVLLDISTTLHEEQNDKRIVCHFFKRGPLAENETTDKQTQTEEDWSMSDKLRQECQRLLEENNKLMKRLLEYKLTEEGLQNDDKKVSYYTGLPQFLTLMALYNLLEAFIPSSKFLEITKFQKLMLVLMKLRLNLPTQDLAYRFAISKSSASRIFDQIINIMYVRTKELIYWPDRDELQLTMPMEFRKFFNLKCSTIIDCFEIFIERPSALLARAKTWSNYKHHNTVKYLIGITPQGTISFISKGWGGRASDKHITENCGLLEKLLPGDLVLADRGFDIQESVGIYCAEVKIPSFTKGKSQLSAPDIELTRKIAHVRIHVERVIGLVRNKYSILQGTIPIDYLSTQSDSLELPTIDKIVTVCCALSNMCESVVPFE